MISFTLKESLDEKEFKKLYSQELICNKEKTGNPALDALMESSMAMKFTQFNFHPN
jgi:hypothetical protein